MQNYHAMLLCHAPLGKRFYINYNNETSILQHALIINMFTESTTFFFSSSSPGGSKVPLWLIVGKDRSDCTYDGLKCFSCRLVRYQN